MQPPASRPTLLLLPLLAATLLAAPPPLPAQSGTFGGATDVVVVEVPVQVIRDGEPMSGLTADDFEVYDGRRKQEIVGFEVIDLRVEGGEATPAPDLPVAGRRHFLLFFDLSFSDPTTIVRARQAAYELVRDSLHPTDLVGVATYSESRGPQLVLGFTSDRPQVRAAIDDLGFADPMERVRDPLGLVFDSGFGVSSPGAAGGGSLGGIRGGAEIEAQIRELSGLTGRSARDQKEGQVLALTSSLEQVAQLMKSVQGRKHVVFLSEGFDTSVILGAAGSTLDEQERLREMAAAAASGEFWNVDSEERYGSTTGLNRVTRMLEEFERADCVIQAVDIGGLRAGGDVEGSRAQSGVRAGGQDGLFLMANETGGELYRNFNDLGEAMGEMLRRTSVTYLLAFQPEKLELDGEYHKLRVKLKNESRGVRLVHRPGYFAPRPYGEMSGLEKRMLTAEAIVGGGSGGLLDTAVLAAPFSVPGESAYVPVLIEVGGEALLAAADGDVLPVELYAYALGEDGEVADYFGHVLSLDRAEAEPLLRRSGLKYWGHFDLQPGDYVVRVLVRHGEAGTAGLDSASLEVPAFDRAEGSLLPPLFPEPAGKWILGRERPEEQREVSYPFMLQGQPFIPAARPVVPHRGEAAVALVGYRLGEAVTVRHQLYAADGSEVEGAELTVSERTSSSGADQLVATFAAGKVPAGSYTLVVTVAEEDGSGARSSSIPLVVAG